MDNARDDTANAGDDVELKQPEPAAGSNINPDAAKASAKSPKKDKKSKAKCKKHKAEKRGKKGKSKKSIESESGSDDSSSDESVDSGSDESSEDESSVDEELAKRKKSGKKAVKLRKTKDKKKKKRGKTSKKYESPSSSSDDSASDDSDSDSGSESDDEPRHSRRRRGKKSRQAEASEDDAGSAEESVEADSGNRNQELYDARLQAMLLEQQRRKLQLLSHQNATEQGHEFRLGLDNELLEAARKLKKKKAQGKKKSRKGAGKRASTLEFKRVDELWDNTIHNYKLTESVEDQADEFNTYIFTVRRKFDWENKYRNTVVDIKSKLLREALQEVLKDVKGVSLVEEQPCIDPNMLFLYLEELRQYAKKTLKARAKKEKKKKNRKRTNLMISHCKVMISFLDEDYNETKKTLYPMLESGNITFDLLWALFKPNTLAYTTTYGSVEHPRCFKVDYATKESSFIRGEWYCIEGRYLEYDGKNYGLGDFEINVDSFKGPRKITSLATYPLRYHKDPEGIKKQLVERGKKFVTLTGMNYRFHKGLAFEKKKKTVAKHNINGRVMIDPAIFRRINPNYPISLIKPKDQDASYGVGSCCGCSDDDSDEDGEPEGPQQPLADGEEQESGEKFKVKVVYDEKKDAHVVQVPVDDDGSEIQTEKLDKLAKNADGTETKQEFTEEELLIASPIVLGFAFSEKRWMEFSLSGVRDIEWNEGAFESLVLPGSEKSVVKALVSSHKFHAAETIDDVVQGKGRGLVFVLHGPPGVGKTLTAEGIADYLKCPLYAVSAGELGTESWRLEQELQKIMDIAHSWGAILLLDEADVFLEKRQVHDIHRNALVSIFLRLLEYFQGILFLTTNRVETFDGAFQSRIHMGLRYDELSHHAKREIWRMFLTKVKVMEGAETVEFKDDDYNTLARHELNGRQIKNAVRTAQALAVNEGHKLSMEHIKCVLQVAENFERDLKGGSGYLDAMRSYT